MWTPSALASERRDYNARVIRIVEAQHRISTNRLTENAEDQALLEALADEVKPDLPEAAQGLPWLLASPFRYGLGRPSRFRAANVFPGILYASEDIDTAVSEAAYWRLTAFSRSPGFLLPRTPTPMSAFSVRVKTAYAIDITAPPFDADVGAWTHPVEYTATQKLAEAARAAEVSAIRALSTRRKGGINLAVLDPAAFASAPRPHSSWALFATPGGLLAIQEMSGKAMRFSQENFGLIEFGP